LRPCCLSPGRGAANWSVPACSRSIPAAPAYVLVLPYLLIRAHGVPDLDDTKAARDVAWRGDSGGS
jgi:hypothetical protein